MGTSVKRWGGPTKIDHGALVARLHVKLNATKPPQAYDTSLLDSYPAAREAYCRSVKRSLSPDSPEGIEQRWKQLRDSVLKAAHEHLQPPKQDKHSVYQSTEMVQLIEKRVRLFAGIKDRGEAITREVHREQTWIISRSLRKDYCDDIE